MIVHKGNSVYIFVIEIQYTRVMKKYKYTIFINGGPVKFGFFTFSKKVMLLTLPSTTKYVVFGNFNVFGSTAAKLWNIQI